MSQVLGVASQTLHNCVKAEAQGRLKGTSAKPVSAEQMEISRLRAELVRTKMERDILKKATAYFTKSIRIPQRSFANVVPVSVPPLAAVLNQDLVHAMYASTSRVARGARLVNAEESVRATRHSMRRASGFTAIGKDLPPDKR